MADHTCECPACGRLHRHLGTPPWALSHEDLCRLSRVFNGAPTTGNLGQDGRINEWLKRHIAAAIEASATDLDEPEGFGNG